MQPIVFVQDRHGRPILRYEATSRIRVYLNETMYPVPEDFVERQNATEVLGTLEQRLEYYAEGRAEFQDLVITKPSDGIRLFFEFLSESTVLSEVDVAVGATDEFEVTYLVPPEIIPHPREPFPYWAIIVLFTLALAAIMGLLWWFRGELARWFGIRPITEPFRKSKTKKDAFAFADRERIQIENDIAEPEYVIAMDDGVSSEGGFDTHSEGSGLRADESLPGGAGSVSEGKSQVAGA